MASENPNGHELHMREYKLPIKYEEFTMPKAIIMKSKFWPNIYEILPSESLICSHSCILLLDDHMTDNSMLITSNYGD